MKFMNIGKIFLLLTLFALTANLSGFTAEPVTKTTDVTEEATAKATEETNWKENLRDKMDTSIAIMNIINEDITEMEEAEKKEALSQTPVKPLEEQTWQDRLRAFIDRASKIMKIVKDDLSDYEDLEKRAAETKAKQ